MASLPTERKKYEPRPLPAEDLAAYVQQSITRSPYRFDVVVRLHGPLAALDMDFEIIEPAEFKSFAADLSRRLNAAAGM